MEVPQNSGRKWCTDCYKERRRVKAKESYKDEMPESRLRAVAKRKEKIKNDPVERLFVRAKARSCSSGHKFNLTREDIIIPDKCPVLGTEFEYKTEQTMSVDRIDSSKGYVKGNVQVISWKANMMKNSATPEELLKFAEWVLRTYGKSDDPGK